MKSLLSILLFFLVLYAVPANAVDCYYPYTCPCPGEVVCCPCFPRGMTSWEPYYYVPPPAPYPYPYYQPQYGDYGNRNYAPRGPLYVVPGKRK